MENIITVREADIEVISFPDGHPHIRITKSLEGHLIRLVWPIRNPKELFGLMQISEALDALGAQKIALVIPYLMAARFDRRMQEGDSFDLKIVAQIVNHCRFDRVELIDVHSDVATALIENSVNLRPLDGWAFTINPETIIICPDAGAAKKLKDCKNEIVHCVKQRDPSNGRIVLRVLEPGRCTNKDCVIPDDICDGGATFIAIAEQIQPRHLTLAVTHGIFSKGFSELNKHFHNIVATDSYQSEAAIRSDPFFANQPAPRNLIVIPLNL